MTQSTQHSQPGAPPPKEEAPDQVEGSNNAFDGAEDNTTRGIDPVSTSGSTAPAPALPGDMVGGLTYDEIVGSVADEYLDRVAAHVAAGGATPSPAVVKSGLVAKINKALKLENAARTVSVSPRADANEKNQMPLLQTLPAGVVAMVLIALHGVRRLLASRGADAQENSLDPLVCWDPERGVYVQDPGRASALAGLYNRMGGVSFLKDVESALYRLAPRIRRETSHLWAPVANGDYERATGVLHPFSPDRVFLSRSPVAYVADAQNPVIHNDEDGTDWDFDSWLMEIADGDEELCGQLWELFASVVQPHIRTNRAVALYDKDGNNGKGTIVALATKLAGEANTLAASLRNLGKDTTLPLISGKSLIVSDENATNDFVKNAEVVKSLATRDPILVNPKYKQPYNEVFEGTQIHCMNELPRFGDHGGSMWRRWLLLRLSARFEGRERKYIKDDYINRPEVLQYVMRRALEMDFREYSQTSASAALLQEAKAGNDPVRLFWTEHRDEFTWDLLPFEFLYEVYKGWFARDKPSGRMVDRASFDDSLRAAVADEPGEWIDHGKGERMKASMRMAATEPLVTEYEHRNRYEMPEKWKRPGFAKAQQFRNVLYRDRVGSVIAAAGVPAVSAVSAVPVPAAAPAALQAAEARLAQIEQLVAADQALWESRAVSDDGVTNAGHVPAHADIRRIGSRCSCGVTSQQPYDASEFSRSEELRMALIAARQERDELLGAT